MAELDLPVSLTAVTTTVARVDRTSRVLAGKIERAAGSWRTPAELLDGAARDSLARVAGEEARKGAEGGEASPWWLVRPLPAGHRPRVPFPFPRAAADARGTEEKKRIGARAARWYSQGKGHERRRGALPRRRRAGGAVRPKP